MSPLVGKLTAPDAQLAEPELAMEQRSPQAVARPEPGWADEPSLEVLYRQYAPWLGAMLRKRFGQGFEAEADDMVQETYIRIAPYRDAAPIRRPQALLMRVASNLARDFLRRRVVRGRHAQEVANGPDLLGLTIDDPLQNLLVKETILSIPEAYREVFVLSRFGGLTYEEIATRCDLSIKSVEWRLSKAIAHCTKRNED